MCVPKFFTLKVVRIWRWIAAQNRRGLAHERRAVRPHFCTSILAARKMAPKSAILCLELWPPFDPSTRLEVRCNPPPPHHPRQPALIAPYRPSWRVYRPALMIVGAWTSAIVSHQDHPMRQAYYFLCPLPAVLLLVSLIAPSGWPQGGPEFSFQLGLLVAITISCVVITLLGLLLIALSISDRKSKRGPCIATAVAAAPGIILLILIHLAR
jgi:hypothetical protein